jgi:single-strand DNA-binding protein
MAMLNRTILVGRITRDLELKVTQSNIPVVTFTLAVNRQYRDEQGNQTADFIQCVAWRKQAENLEKYCGKGSLIGIDGRIQTRQYEASEGIRHVTEVVCESVVFLDTRREQQEDDEDETSPYDMMEKEEKVEGCTEEDLPF